MSERDDGGPAFPVPVAMAEQVGAMHSELQGMSVRTYAAITLRVPDSGQPWLDDMIREARRMDAAERIMAAMTPLTEEGGDTVMNWRQMVQAATKAARVFVATLAAGKET